VSEERRQELVHSLNEAREAYHASVMAMEEAETDLTEAEEVLAWYDLGEDE
jgi:hypothetical protein